MLHIKSVKYISGFKIRVAFDDGTEGDVDLREHLNGLIFEPLKDKDVFSKVSVDAELKTIVWPNGADLHIWSYGSITNLKPVSRVGFPESCGARIQKAKCPAFTSQDPPRTTPLLQ